MTFNRVMSFILSFGFIMLAQLQADTQPVINAGPDRNVNQGQLLSFTVTASDTDGGSVALSAADLPEGASFGNLSSNSTWDITSGPSGGAVLALHSMGTTLFTGTIGGVFRSENNGDSWTRVSNGLTNTKVRSLHSVGNILFVGTHSVSGTEGGVFRSEDNGNSWTKINNGLKNIHIINVASLHSIGPTLFAGTNAGVFRSENIGDSWTQIANFGSSVERLHSVGSILFAGAGGGVFRSEDNGNSWLPINNGLPNSGFRSLYSMGSTLFAGFHTSGVFRSEDNGNSWTQVNNGLPNIPLTVFSLYSTGSTMFAGTSFGVYFTEDYGDSWTLASNGLPAVYSFHSIGSSIFAGTGSNGVYRSEDNGNSWNEINNGITGPTVSSLHSIGTVLFAGAQEGVYRSEDNGASWTQVHNGLTNTQIHALHSIGSTLFAGTHGGGVFRSVDNGNSWTRVRNGLSSFYVLALHSIGSSLFAGTVQGGMCRSEDYGDNWTCVNNGLPNIHSLHSIGSTLFAGTFHGGSIFRSEDNGASWAPANNGFPNAVVYSLHSIGSTLFAGTGNSGIGVWRSEDNGNSWTQVLTTPPVFSLHSIGSILFAGTYHGGGVYRSEDNGDNWIPINSGLPSAEVRALHSIGSVLFSGTWGAGVFRLSETVEGIFSWTPNIDQGGVYPIVFRAESGNLEAFDTVAITVPVININNPPTANAGPNVTIPLSDVALTTIVGTVSDSDEDDEIECRWLEGATVLHGFELTTGECPLSLEGLGLAIGQHTLTLEVTDGIAATTDDMILNIENSSPAVAASGGGTFEIGSIITLGGEASDFDGDLLTYTISVDEILLCSGECQTIAGGYPVSLKPCEAEGFELGAHTATIEVSDGFNAPVSDNVVIEIVDNTSPTLAPVSNRNILWPPNHKMVDLIIEANADDNSGVVHLSASVSSNEPIDGTGDGDMAPDWTQPVIDQTAGVVSLQLRAERSGSGSGRSYSILIAATDDTGNVSSSTVEVKVPHSKGKK